MGFFDRLFRRKLIEALPEPSENEIEDSKKSANSHKNFTDKLRKNIETNINVVQDKQKDQPKVYNPKNYIHNYRMYKWYVDAEERHEYYSSHNITQNTDENLKYNGAVELHNNEDKTKSIMLTVMGEDKREFKLEIGKITDGKSRDIIRRIDQIIAVQVGDVYKGRFLKEEIERLNDELSAEKGLELTDIGQQILLNSDRRDIVIGNTEIEENNEREQEALKNLNKKIDKVYDFCKLAIDIGVFEKDDWNAISQIHKSTKLSEKIKGKDKDRYITDAKWRRESYDKIKKEYMDKKDLKMLNRDSIKDFSNERKEGLTSIVDTEEEIIKAYAQEKMLSMPMEYENEILAYQIIYKDDESRREKREMLDDMVLYAKMKYLEKQGIILNRYVEKEDERIA